MWTWLAPVLDASSKAMRPIRCRCACVLLRVVSFRKTGYKGGHAPCAVQQADAVLVDETSMLDLPLAAALMGALPWTSTCQLVIVGASRPCSRSVEGPYELRTFSQILWSSWEPGKGLGSTKR